MFSRNFGNLYAIAILIFANILNCQSFDSLFKSLSVNSYRRIEWYPLTDYYLACRVFDDSHDHNISY